MIKQPKKLRVKKAEELVTADIIYTQDIFMDSGAFSIFAKHVLKQGKAEERMGKHGRLLDEPKVVGLRGDYSYYSLKKGSPFRKYCDSYASFVKKFQDRLELFANVDAIRNPEQTWENQLFFEKEHGLRLVPVIHHGEDFRWVDKYLDAGYDILGIGGFTKKAGFFEMIRWTDKVFLRLCPESNNFKPIIRVHGFAASAWKYITRYPWWSVDSTSWIKYTAYGWIVVPRWNKEKGFRYDVPPIIVNMSWRSPFKAKRHKHFNNVTSSVKETIERWLSHLNIPIGEVDKEGNEIKHGVVSYFSLRSTVNLHYYLNLQESLPDWPWPLDEKIAVDAGLNYRGGFNL
jgi:hypothetical protein